MSPAWTESCTDSRCNNRTDRKAVADLRRPLFLCALLAAFSSVPAFAADEPRFQVTPVGTYVTGGEFEDDAGLELDADESTGFGLVLSLEELPGRYYELIYTDASTEVDAATPFDIDITYIQIGGTVSWPESTRVIPYLGATLGAAMLKPDSSGLDSVTRLAFSLGGGVRIPITANIGVRLEIRSYATLLGGDADLFCRGAGSVTCNFLAESDTFLQHTAQAGISIGFGK